MQKELIEEYKVCQQKTADLSANIWKSAVVFGVGSVAGIAILSKENSILDYLDPWLRIVIIVFAIGLLMAWYRFARRWWSIELVMFRRMEHIERQSKLRANLYIAHLDGREAFTAGGEEGESPDKPSLGNSLLEDLNKLEEGYERRGIQPVMRFVIEANIALWAAFLFLVIVPLIPSSVVPDGPTALKLAVVLVFAVLFFLRLGVQWGKL